MQSARLRRCGGWRALAVLAVLSAAAWAARASVHVHVHHDAETFDAFGQLVRELPYEESAFHDDERFMPAAVSERLSRWILRENLARAGHVRGVDDVHLPVVVNVILCGFLGDGDGLRLTEEQVRPWFEHVEHVVRHEVMPVGEYQTTSVRREARDSAVRHRIHLNAVQFSPMFETILEDAMLWNTRLEHGDVEDEHMSDHYINSDRITVMLSSVCEHLGLSDSYNIFLINPNRPVSSDVRYGYRRGFSDWEIRKVYEAGSMSVPDLPIKECPVRDEAQLPPRLRPKNGTARFQVVDMIEPTERWAQWYIQMVFKGDYPTMAVGGLDSGVEGVQDPEDASAYLFYRPKTDPDIVDYARMLAENGTRNEKDYLLEIEEMGPHMHEDCLVDAWVGHGRVAFVDLQAGPFEWGPSVAGDGSKTRFSVPRPPRWDEAAPFEEQHELHDAPPAATEKEQSLRSMSEFTRLHCQGTRANSPKCLSLTAQRDSLMAERVRDGTDLMGSNLEGAEADAPTDRFLAELAVVVSRAVRTLVVPPVPEFDLTYPQRIVYHVFVIVNQASYDPLGEYGFDYEEYQHELKALRAPGQEIVFTMKKLHMADSATISAAFHSSLRSAIVPSLSPDGRFNHDEHVFVDSRALRERLAAFRSEIDKAHNKQARIVQTERHVPIFLFSLEYNAQLPVFVDKYYQAKALSDMVLIMQSPFASWPSRFHCNGKAIYKNTRNPVKEALAATALLVGGLPHQHLTYNEASRTAAQNWMWAVGDSPLSHLSRGTHFNAFQADALVRNHIASALDASVAAVNKVFRRLQAQETQRENVDLEDMPLFKGLYTDYEAVKKHWAFLAEKVGDMQLQEALASLPELASLVAAYEERAEAVLQHVEATRCLATAQIQLQVEEHGTGILLLVPVLFLVFDALVVVLVIMCRPNVRKVKTN